MADSAVSSVGRLGTAEVLGLPSCSFLGFLDFLGFFLSDLDLSLIWIWLDLDLIWILFGFDLILAGFGLIWAWIRFDLVGLAES